MARDTAQTVKEYQHADVFAARNADGYRQQGHPDHQVAGGLFRKSERIIDEITDDHPKPDIENQHHHQRNNDDFDQLAEQVAAQCGITGNSLEGAFSVGHSSRKGLGMHFFRSLQQFF